MIDDNILLVTDDDEVTESVLSKLVLLRESDSIAVCDYKLAKRTLETPSVSIVIIHENIQRDKTLNLIKSIKSDNYDIILLANKSDDDFILTCYDMGVMDFLLLNSEPYEMLIRTVNCFKSRSFKTKSTRDAAILKQLGVVDEETGFYKYKFSKDLLAQFVQDRKVQNGMFVILTIDESSKTRFSADKLSKAIKQSVRCDDIVSIVKGGKFYIVLPNIDKLGTISVVDKIQNILGEKVIIRAGMARVTNKSFERLEKEAFSSLSEAIQIGQTIVFLEEHVKTLDDWLEDDEKDDKNYKIFKNAYNNKLEKVITPVFYRLQKTYEEKLFKTKIEQYSDELQSVFQLKKQKRESRLKITYPGFAKIIIYKIHDGLDTPENSEVHVNLNEITQKGLSKIVEDFIKEFRSLED